MGHSLEDPEGQGRIVVHSPQKRPFVQGEYAGLPVCPDRRRARLPLEDRHLAEDVPGCQLSHNDLSTTLLVYDLRPPGLNHVHLIAPFPLATDDLLVDVFLTQCARFHTQSLPVVRCRARR